VHATADGHVVVLHDETLDRTTDGHGLVREATLAQLERLDAGHHHRAPDGTYPFRDRGMRVPTLAALLAAHPDVPLNIEIKQDQPPIEGVVLEVLDRYDARSCTLLAAEHGHIMTRIRAAAPEMLTSFAAPEVAEFVQRVRARDVAGYQAPGIALQVPARFGETEIVTPELVAAAHELDLEVHVWTVNDEPEMERLLDLGVDALMSDFPGRAAAVLARRRR
jgi:glycerophosphoryl diester phosphodiesterase